MTKYRKDSSNTPIGSEIEILNDKYLRILKNVDEKVKYLIVISTTNRQNYTHNVQFR